MTKFNLVTDQEILEGYLTDASNIQGQANGLFRPTSAQEVSEIVRYCQENKLPLTVTAQRTSTTGGPVPFGGMLLSMELMNQIHSDTEVDAGAYLGEYQAELEKKGLFFPPDPTSRNECSVGGAISCNASGARSFRYGATRPWVEKLEVVFPTGEIQIIDRNTPIPEDWMLHWTPPSVKTAAGYEPCDNLLDLMIGQEGTLGIITRAWLKIIPLPQEVLGMIVFFSSLEDCLSFVSIAKEGAQTPQNKIADPDALNPRAIEFFDHNALGLIRQKVDDIPENAHCGLFMEIEHEGKLNLENWFEKLEETGALVDDIILAEDEAGREKLYVVRHAIPAGVNEIVVANGMPKVGTDFAVPDHGLEHMMEAYDSVDMEHVLFGHIGDNHLHLNFLPKTPDELAFAKEMYRELALMAVSLGGTVSAEHGIGKIKKELLAEMLGDSVIQSFRVLKKKLDPNWILGRGILFDEA